MSGWKGRREWGFYREFLVQRGLRSPEAREAEVAAIKGRVLEALRRRPGNGRLLVQGNQLLLRAATLGRPRVSKWEAGENTLQRALELMGDQSLPPASGALDDPAEEDLAQGIAAVVNGIGDQLVPPGEDAGGRSDGRGASARSPGEVKT